MKQKILFAMSVALLVCSFIIPVNAANSTRASKLSSTGTYVAENNNGTGEVVLSSSDLMSLANQIDELESTYKSKTAEALGKIGTTVSATASFDDLYNAILHSQDATANASQILKSYSAWVNGSKLVGTMTNNGSTGATGLKAGESYTIPAGYTSGGTVTTATLASQTQATASAANIASGKTAWVNGVKVTGTGADITTAYDQGVADGKTKIILGSTGYTTTAFDSFSYRNAVVGVNTSYNTSKDIDIVIPLISDEAYCITFGFNEAGYSGATSYSYEGYGSVVYRYTVSLDNGVEIDSGSPAMLYTRSAAVPALSWRSHVYNLFDYDRTGAENIIIHCSASSHVQGGVHEYSQAGTGFYLQGVYAYYLQ